MNKNGIIKTAICRFDPKEKCYIVQSPLFDRCIGAAKTKEKAWKIFYELLDEFYIAYLEGNLFGYEKPGRPRKRNVELHALVKPEIKKEIANTAKDFGVSQGEVIEYLYSLTKLIEPGETAYLLRSPKNAIRLAESVAEIEYGKAKKRKLIEK